MKQLSSPAVQELLSQDTYSIRDTMLRINQTSRLCQIVVNQDGYLVGTVTDGDIRRALLRGITIDQPVLECMNPSPLKGTTSGGADNLGTLSKVDSEAGFLPVVDNQGRLQGVLFAEALPNQNRTAVIMAGGLGKRLGKRTSEMPKPLVEVGGRPMIDHCFDALEGAGYGTIYVTVNYLSDQIEDHIAAQSRTAWIKCIREPNYLGTAGSLALLRNYVMQSILVMNADVVTGVDLNALNDFHSASGKKATIGAAAYEARIPYGVIDYDQTGEFRGILEKPTVRHFISAGIYILEAEFLALLESGQAMDMPELLNAGRMVGLPIGIFPIQEYWRDLGNPRDLEQAEKDLSSLRSPAKPVQ